jgi:hypothetical protein
MGSSAATPGEVAREAGREGRIAADLGGLALDIDGVWKAAEMAALLARLDEAYIATGTLYWLSIRHDRPSTALMTPRWTAEEAAQAATAFYLGGGLTLASIRYGTPGILVVLGALNPLKYIQRGISDWRKTNTEREAGRLHDARARAAEEHRHDEEMARIKIAQLKEAHQLATDLIKFLPEEQRGPAASQLLARFYAAVAAIGADLRVVQTRMLPEST